MSVCLFLSQSSRPCSGHFSEDSSRMSRLKPKTGLFFNQLCFISWEEFVEQDLVISAGLPDGATGCQNVQRIPPAASEHNFYDFINISHNLSGYLLFIIRSIFLWRIYLVLQTASYNTAIQLFCCHGCCCHHSTTSYLLWMFVYLSSAVTSYCISSAIWDIFWDTSARMSQQVS